MPPRASALGAPSRELRRAPSRSGAVPSSAASRRRGLQPPASGPDPRRTAMGGLLDRSRRPLRSGAEVAADSLPSASAPRPPRHARWAATVIQKSRAPRDLNHQLKGRTRR